MLTTKNNLNFNKKRTSLIDPFYCAHVYTAMTGLQSGGIKNKIRGELILNLPEKFKLGRVSSIRWLAEKGKHRPASAPYIYCSVIRIFLFQNRNSPFT